MPRETITKVISAENVEGGNSSLRNSWKKQKETVKFFFLFKIITLSNLFNCYFLWKTIFLKFWSVFEQRIIIITSHLFSLSYMLCRMYDINKDFFLYATVHVFEYISWMLNLTLNAKLYTKANLDILRKFVHKIC